MGSKQSMIVSPNSPLQPQLFQAIFLGEVRAVKELVELNADINGEMYASTTGEYYDRARADAEPGFMTQHSVELVTPLVEACTRGHADIVEYLCDLHIKAKQQQQQQQQKRQDEQRADCTQLNLEWRTRTGETAMHLLCFNTRAYSLSYTPYGNRLQSKPPTPVKDVVRMLRALVDANADVNALTKSKETPLIYASRSCAHRQVVVADAALIADALLDLRANVNAQSTEGRTALHVAVRQGNAALAVVRALLRGKPDLELRNYLGDTPLMSICSNSAIEFAGDDVLKALVQAGAFVCQENKLHPEETAMSLAEKRGRKSVAFAMAELTAAFSRELIGALTREVVEVDEDEGKEGEREEAKDAAAEGEKNKSTTTEMQEEPEEQKKGCSGDCSDGEHQATKEAAAGATAAAAKSGAAQAAGEAGLAAASSSSSAKKRAPPKVPRQILPLPPCTGGHELLYRLIVDYAYEETFKHPAVKVRASLEKISS